MRLHLDKSGRVPRSQPKPNLQWHSFFPQDVVRTTALALLHKLPISDQGGEQGTNFGALQASGRSNIGVGDRTPLSEAFDQLEEFLLVEPEAGRGCQ